MNNLRDQGYPSAREYKWNRSDKRNMPMNNNVFQPNEGFLAAPQTIKFNEPVENRNIVDKLLTAYNNKAFNTSAPMIQKFGEDYVNDDDELARRSGFNVYKNGNRLGFANRNIAATSANYGAGIDNLDPIFGTGTFDKSFNTPFGPVNVGYDSGTAYANYDIPQNAYYIMALINALRSKGSL